MIDKVLGLFPHISAGTAFLPGSGGVGFLVERTVALLSHALLSKQRHEGRINLSRFFCLSKVPQRREVVSLLVAATLC